MIAGLSGQIGVCVCVRNTYVPSPTKAPGLLMVTWCDKRARGVLCTCVWLRNISIDLSGQGPFVTGRTYKCLTAQQAQTGMWFMT